MVLGGSLRKNIPLLLLFLKAPFLILYFSYCTLMTFLMMLSIMLLSLWMILLSTLSVSRHVAKTRFGFWTCIWPVRPCGLGQEVAFWLLCWNWLNRFHFLILVTGPVVIVIGCMIFLSPFLDIIRMSMSSFPFLIQLGSGILCLQNAFLWPLI